jgi:hypothetical protein
MKNNLFVPFEFFLSVITDINYDKICFVSLIISHMIEKIINVFLFHSTSMFF